MSKNRFPLIGPVENTHLSMVMIYTCVAVDTCVQSGAAL